MDVSGRILRAWMPAIHAGMTEAADGQSTSNNGVGVEGYTSFFMLCGRVQTRAHFVVKSLLPYGWPALSRIISRTFDLFTFPTSVCGNEETKSTDFGTL